LNITAKTDIGLVRNHNQDAYATGELSQSMVWAVVCDGMGGPSGGGIASEIAVQTVSNGMNQLLHSESTEEELRRAISEVIISSNERIFEMSESNAMLKGMGTTLVLCILIDSTLTVAHVGDSRAYIIRGNEIIRLTNDHSLVQNLVERGEISEDEASKHPQKNIITRALGVTSEVEFDISTNEIVPNDLILLCTDGLTNLCDDNEILQTVTQTDFNLLPETLINLANKHGGMDNTTVLIIKN